jgi:hypothetical protein
MKYVTLLNENGDNKIINQFDNIQEAFNSFEELNVNDLQDGQEYELAKYDENNVALNWDNEELDAINQPLGSWVTKSII